MKYWIFVMKWCGVVTMMRAYALTATIFNL